MDKNRGGKKSAVRSVKSGKPKRNTRGGLVEKKNIRKGVPSFGKKKKEKKNIINTRERERNREKKTERKRGALSRNDAM